MQETLGKFISSWPSLEVLTFIVALLLSFVRPVRRGYVKYWPWNKTDPEVKKIKCIEPNYLILDFLNGISVMPFFGLIIPLFYDEYFQYISSNKLLMATSGLVGLFFSLGVVFQHQK